MSDEPRITFAPGARIVDAAGAVKIVARDGSLRRLEGDSGDLVREVLDYLREPRTRAEILAHVASRSGQPVETLDVVAQLIDALTSLHAVAPVAGVLVPSLAHGSSRGRVVVAVSGAIAAAYAPQFVQQLHRRGHDVRVAMTRNARRFVSALTLEALTHATVVRSLWPRTPDRPVPHLDLADWADLVVLYPTSATTLARLAAGDCSDVVAALALSTRAPVVVVPSMNPAMYASSGVQTNLARVREHGFQVVCPTFGHEVAERPDRRVPLFGPAPAPEDVASIVDALLAERRALKAVEPIAPDEWERMYKSANGAALPWEHSDVDSDLLAATSNHLRAGARVLEVGAGTGALAVALAEHALSVTATDISPTALALANLRPGAERVVWLEDDVTRTRLHARFDGVVDRGCLHVLAPSLRDGYASAVARLLRVGGILVVKVHAPGVQGVVGTFPMAPDEVATALGRHFRPVAGRASTMRAGAHVVAAANICVLERVAGPAD